MQSEAQALIDKLKHTRSCNTENEEQKRKKVELNRKKTNLQIYVKQRVQMLQEIGSSSLRTFLLKGLTDFFNDRAFSTNLIVSKRMFDIAEIDGQDVTMKNGTKHVANFIPVVTSSTIIVDKKINIVISAISSVRTVKSFSMKSISVLSFYYTNEEEILQIVKDRHSKDDVELHNAVKFVYDVLLENVSMLKHVIREQDVCYIETIEKFLNKK